MGFTLHRGFESRPLRSGPGPALAAHRQRPLEGLAVLPLLARQLPELELRPELVLRAGGEAAGLEHLLEGLLLVLLLRLVDVEDGLGDLRAALVAGQLPLALRSDSQLHLLARFDTRLRPEELDDLVAD